MSWKEISIGELGKVVTGNTPPRKNPEFYGNAYKFIKPTDMNIGNRYTLFTEDFYSEIACKKYIKSLIPPLSTCVVTIGSIGQKMTLTDSHSFVNQAVNAVIPDMQKYDPFFTFYSLKNILHKVKSADTGASSGRENVSKSNFMRLTLEVPTNIETQKKIGSILSSFDNSIENNLKRIKLLEETAQNIYKEWFVNFRFPNYEHAKFDKESGLPIGWKKSQLKNHFPILTGKKDANHSSENGVFPFFTCGKESLLSNDFAFDCDAILLAGNGEFNVKYYRGKFQAYQRTYVLSPQNKNELFLIYINLKLNLQQLTSGSKGSVIKFLTKGMIEEFTFILPNSDLLTLFHNNVNLIYLQVENLTIQNQKLKEARDILLPRLMNRTIEV
jgi:type I restriction enzyme S subunit